MVEGVGEVQRPGQNGTEGQIVGWARKGRGPAHVIDKTESTLYTTEPTRQSGGLCERRWAQVPETVS